MHIERTTLPGIGVRHVFTTAEGRRIGVVEYQVGDRRDIVHDDPDDPDGMVGLTLTRTEASALAALLGFPEVVAVAGLSRYAGSARRGQSSARAPSTAACRVNRSRGSAGS